MKILLDEHFKGYYFAFTKDAGEIWGQNPLMIGDEYCFCLHFNWHVSHYDEGTKKFYFVFRNFKILYNQTNEDFELDLSKEQIETLSGLLSKKLNSAKDKLDLKKWESNDENFWRINLN